VSLLALQVVGKAEEASPSPDSSTNSSPDWYDRPDAPNINALCNRACWPGKMRKELGPHWRETLLKASQVLRLLAVCAPVR
jgi:hypothetical protein